MEGRRERRRREEEEKEEGERRERRKSRAACTGARSTWPLPFPTLEAEHPRALALPRHSLTEEGREVVVRAHQQVQVSS